MGEIAEQWRQFCAYVERLLGKGDIFDIDAHSRLMFDDDLFSRSRHYFWLINTLQEIIKLVRLNIDTWEGYRDHKLKFPQSRFEGGREQPPRENKSNKHTRYFVRCNGINEEWKVLHVKFEEQRMKAISLRDGARDQPTKLSIHN
jgi:hypothetical protein